MVLATVFMVTAAAKLSENPDMNCSYYNTIQYNTIQYNTIQYNTIQYNTIQYNTIQYNTKQYNTIQYNTIKLYCPEPGNSFCSVFLYYRDQ